ncbi:MAG TPA: helix-turn-helix domain-containing protein [Kofleriaceae bacterium]|nr:helix-turn-helix domain-containing protein [Kofleriaceae bacterium]
MPEPAQPELFPPETAPSDAVGINARCLLRTRDGHRAVLVAGVPIAHYAVGDAMAEAYAMVQLVTQGWADQNEVARAFQRSERSVRRYQRRFEGGGLVALGRPGGYPAGRPRLDRSRNHRVNTLRAQGQSHRQIAAAVGVSEKAIRKQLRRLGWPAAEAAQIELPIPGPAADPNLSGPPAAAVELAEPPGPAADPNLSGPPAATVEPAELPGPAADPNLSGPDAATDDEPLEFSADRDPSDRWFDRLLAKLGLLNDAAPLFRAGERVPRAGVLLALPAIRHSGVVEIARDVYGAIGPAFYGLRTTIVALVFLALLRIKRPEALKEHAPPELGRLLGLDRAPEVKTLRRKLARLAGLGRATEFGRQLAARRVQHFGDAMGFLYVDGHVRAYHGKRELPKTHVARMRIAMPATTDYWVNDASGEPLFVVTAEANTGLVKMLPTLCTDIRALVGDRRVTIVFDRGGWSPRLFQKLIADGFDILTYRKGNARKRLRWEFREHRAVLDGREVAYQLADHSILLGGKLELRQVVRLSDDGRHQTQVVTSRRDLPAIEVAYRMFERWRQENFFKYLRDEYALDALVDYQLEPADPHRDVPNPARAALDAQLRAARAQIISLSARYGIEAMANRESRRRTMRGFKIATASLARPVREALRRYATLEARRAKVPRRIPVGDVVDGDVVKLSAERKHLTDVIKMVAYQAETNLVRQIAPHYHRADDEARTLVQSMLANTGDIAVTATELRVTFVPLSSPHRTAVLAALCAELDALAPRFPGTRLRVRYAVAAPKPDTFPAG